MYCYSLQISFRYWKRNSKDNSKFRHHRRINTFSDIHGGYISDGIVLGFRTYISPYSEDYYQNNICIIALFLTPFKGLIAKVRTACRCIRLFCRYEKYYIFASLRTSLHCITIRQHLWIAMSYVTLIMTVISLLSPSFSVKVRSAARTSALQFLTSH